jgi:hypothetical protein
LLDLVGSAFDGFSNPGYLLSVPCRGRFGFLKKARGLGDRSAVRADLGSLRGRRVRSLAVC